jgi:hypothetical protein
MTDNAEPFGGAAEDPKMLLLGQELDQIEQQWKDRRVKDMLDQDPEPELESWTIIHTQLYPIAARILQRKALTRTGLAIQARATSMVFAEYWTPDFLDEEGVDGYIRLFVEAACAFAGVLPVPIAAERTVHPNAFPTV